MGNPSLGQAAALPLAETHTLTESRGEASDPDADLVFAETHTLTKTNNESNDDDAGAWARTVQWDVGDRRPLLFRGAVAATGEAPHFEYDPVLSLNVDDVGKPLISSAGIETMTHTAQRAETDDADR